MATKKTPSDPSKRKKKPRISQPSMPSAIGPYKVESFLGKGGTSHLYFALHSETEEPVTIKVLSPDQSKRSDLCQQFQREAEILSSLNHPNISHLREFGDWEGGPYMALEYIQGTSLRQLILKNALSVRKALELVVEISEALKHLHSQQIAHLDLKPENILITEDGHIKIIDFGIAKQLSQEKAVIDSPKVVGTPVYMSPEQRKDFSKATELSDLYSLGVLTYEMVLGRLSHGSIHISLMPRGLQKILAKALQPRPQHRQESISMYCDQIQAFLKSAHFAKDVENINSQSLVSERLYQAQIRLLPPQIPNWDRVQVGTVNHRELYTSGVYHDFFTLSDGALGVVIVESPSPRADGIVFTGVLRGLLRSLAHFSRHAESIMTAAHDLLQADSMGQQFSASFLVLDPREEIMEFVCCGGNPLWHLPIGVKRPKQLHIENHLLGSSHPIPPKATTQRWSVGDRVLLLSRDLMQQRAEEQNGLTDQELEHILLEHRHTPPQRTVETLFRASSKTTPTGTSERARCVILLDRVQ